VPQLLLLSFVAVVAVSSVAVIFEMFIYFLQLFVALPPMHFMCLCDVIIGLLSVDRTALIKDKNYQYALFRQFALCGSCPLVTPYYCRLGDLLCFVFIVRLLCFSVTDFCYCTIFVPSVL